MEDDEDKAPLAPLSSPLEEAIARAWASALGRQVDCFGATSNFFWLRGDSLSALRACRALRDEVMLPKDDPGALRAAEDSGAQHSQKGEAGLLIEAEAPEGAVCILSAALGALAPCELLARPTLHEYANFLAERGVTAINVSNTVADGNSLKAENVDDVATAVATSTVTTVTGKITAAVTTATATTVDSLGYPKAATATTTDGTTVTTTAAVTTSPSPPTATTAAVGTLPAAATTATTTPPTTTTQKATPAKATRTTAVGTLPELALVAAAREGRDAIVKALLCAGTRVEGPVPSISGRPPRGFTPLHAAATAGHATIVEQLVAAKANLRAMTEARTSPAHLAAAQGGAAVLGHLLAVQGDAGIATWARDADQQTILHLAARSGDLASLKLLLVKFRGLRAKDGGLEAKDRWGRSALQWAIANGHEDVAVMLMKAGAYSGSIPEALLADLNVDPENPSRPGRPIAARKVVQSFERIKALVDVLPETVKGCSEQQVFALTALRDFCCGERQHREMAMEAGAVPRLIALLSGDPAADATAAAAQTLRNIAADRPGTTAVLEAGGEVALAALMARGSEFPAAWRAAAAIVNLAEWPENLDALRNAGVVELFKEMGGQVPASLQS
eukprot:TRINITY_DN8800_c0_g2_i1.p1 TRINITY_DN8800_c0_g2~~TRINITY_DN8800_c0_g2_i1.p1  ORF type:complete len:629 (-),score=191.32 TRINITY_DN8800_c0_g2_i1:97-1959(-)